MTNPELIEQYFDKLWPICRSLTGDGLRDSFKIVQELIPLNLTEVPTGTTVYDWNIPKEWNIKDAYIVTPSGEKICELSKNNLNVVNYSVPVKKSFTFDQLKPHLHTLPELPEAIPYLTSYYKEAWGFCMSHNQFLKLPRSGKYEVIINSRLESGSLTYGDLLLPGQTSEEIIFTSYLCHPSMANNELSGPLVLAFLYQTIIAIPNRKYTYRFILAPETIGHIAYLSKHGNELKEKVIAGYVITCTGIDAPFTYKRSKQQDHLVNILTEYELKQSGQSHSITDFSIGGSDERQYCSPGFNLPIGSLMRTPYQQYKEYHTSLDNKDLISFSALNDSVKMYAHLVKAFELNKYYTNTNPFCEPQLGKRGLYTALGGQKSRPNDLSKRLHLLTYADGNTNLLEIAKKLDISILEFENTVEELINAGLLIEV